MLGALAVVLGMTVPMVTLSGESVLAANNPPSYCDQHASTALVSLCVESSTNGSTTPPYNVGIQKGKHITEFKWLLNEDSTGDPALTPASVADCLPARAAVTHEIAGSNPALAIYQGAGSGSLASCQWPSVHASAGHSTVVASGNQGDLPSLANLADGKYLISVMSNGYKIDGVHFEVAAGGISSVNEEPGAPFIVKMNPLPKKTATIRVHVYNDNASTNGQWDGQTETLLTCADATPAQVRGPNCRGSRDALLVADPSTDMSGFSVHITDVLAETTTDVYGNPLCTQYEVDNKGNVILNDDGTPNPIVFDGSNGAAGGDSGNALAGTESTCLSDHYGDIVIPNMGPNRYAVTVVPPDPRTHNGDKWVQTTTLEGGHDWDSWNIEGGTGYDTELIVGGERVPPIAHGFVKLTHNDQVWNAAEASGNDSAYYNAAGGFTGGTVGTGVLKGVIAIGRAYIGSGGPSALAGTNLANAKKDGVIEDGLISISCIATCSAPTDSAVWTGRARADGVFEVHGLQTGDYTVAFWDETQSYILAVLQYSITGYPAITGATRISGGSSAGQLTLTFGSDSGLAVGATIPLEGASNATWNGTFVVTNVSNRGRTVRVQRQDGAATTATSPTPPHINNITDAGDILLAGWFTDLQGVVFNDLNGNGIRDTVKGQLEPGIPGFGLSERTRGNSVQDQGANFAVTNDQGEYDLSQGYPLGQFLIAEAYNPRYKNTGFTYSTDNDTTPKTVLSAQVDVDFLPVIGLSGHLDWGVQAYGTGTDYWSGGAKGPAPKNENGGIVGTVSYDVTRNEFDPAFSAQEDYQPGIPGISMQLWKTHKTDGIHVDTYKGSAGTSGAVQQWGIQPNGVECMRPDTSRGTNAVAGGQPCKPYDYYVTESWTRPTGCTALDVNGQPLAGELALPDAPTTADPSHTDPANPGCVEAPMSGMQIGGDGTVDGNYALTSLIKPSTLNVPAGTDLEAVYADAQNNPAQSDALTSGDYVVEAVNPVDTVNAKDVPDTNVGGFIDGANPNRLFRFTDETAINVMGGDSYVPQQGFSGPTAGAPGGYALQVTPSSPIRYDRNSLGAGTVALCAGSTFKVPAIGAAGSGTGQGALNPDLNDAGGNPYAGRTVPVCDAKVVTVAGGRSMPAGFFMYTEVPLPSKFYGLVNDDLNVQTDRRSIMLGEVAPASNVPVGVYDENGNWKLTAHSDVNGFYEILLPSTGTYNCPLPAGPCANVYRLVGNDPGTLSHRNLDYNPQFRTIATEFQAWPGVVHPVDQAPTHNGITIEGPAAQFGALSLCKLDVKNPVLFSIDKPYYDPGTGGDGGRTYTIRGSGFGTAATTTLTIGNTATAVSTSSTENTISFKVPSSVANAPGAYQLSIRANGLNTVNGLTFHVLSPGSGNNSVYLQRRDVYEVRPEPTTDGTSVTGIRVYTPQMDAWDTATDTPSGFSGNAKPIGTQTVGTAVSGGRAIQRAIERARQDAGNGNNARPKLIVIYPNTAPNYAPHNPFAAYFENVVLHSKIKLQGVGPGGAITSSDIAQGSNIDASQFWSATQVVPPGGNQDTSDGSYSDDWRTFAAGLNRQGAGPADLPEGEGVLAIAENQNQYVPGNQSPSSNFRAGLDGLLLTGGDQQGNPGNINTLPGGIADVAPGPLNPGPAQGGAVMLDQYVRDFHITNNQIQSNGGTYGTIRIGTPDLPGNANASSNHNDRLNVANNRIVANGGTNLAGALGVFAGTDNYTVTGNDFCGNFSAEYGGAISHYGRSNSGTISKNRIYYNQGYDEGGGIMIAGALPANNNQLSPGAGPVTIDSNTLISNQSNDDGGGIRFLMAGNFPEMVSNNIIANNLSTHEGGGVALDDAPNVTLVNNTIVKNITTGTAATNAAITTAAGSIKPANPAGLSTGGNSVQLQGCHDANTCNGQPSMPANSPNWSKPKLLNNIFADNRAGWAELPTATMNGSAIHGIGDPTDTANSIPQRWDIGVSSTAGLGNGGGAPFAFTGAGNTTNATTAAFNGSSGALSYVSPTNNINPALDGTGAASVGGVGFVHPQDFAVDSLMWRNNTNVSFPVIVAQMVPITLLADYHLLTPASTGINGTLNTGLNSGDGATAPARDIDGDTRTAGSIDRGADELGTNADFAITKSASPATVTAGGAVSYTITVSNYGPAAGLARVIDNLPGAPAAVTGTWSCTSSGAVTCPASISAGNLSQDILLPTGASASFVFTGTVAVNAPAGSVTNTATIAPAPGSGVNDNFAGNNSASAVFAVQVSGNLKVAVTPASLPTVVRNQILPYVVTVSNTGTTTMKGQLVTLNTGSTIGLYGFTCVATGAGSDCGGAGLGNINRTVTVAGGGTVTFMYSTLSFFGVPLGIGVSPTAGFGSNIAESATLGPIANYVDTNAADDASSVTSKVVARSNLVLTNTTTAATPQGNGTYTYTVQVSNLGSNRDPIAGIALSNPLPPGVNFTTWSCAGGASNCGGAATGNGAVTRTINVPANGSVTFTITAQRSAGTTGVVNSTATAVIPPNTQQGGTLTATRAVTFS
ncbi:MAG: large repetitive protein [Ilumatobacteraceae bacterium]